MANTYKVLAQRAPTASTLFDIYAVPTSNSAVISTMNICNTSFTTASSFRIAIRPANTALVTASYIAYDVPIAVGDSIALTMGVTLAATDVVSVFSAGNVTFNLFGSEIY